MAHDVHVSVVSATSADDSLASSSAKSALHLHATFSVKMLCAFTSGWCTEALFRPRRDNVNRLCVLDGLVYTDSRKLISHLSPLCAAMGKGQID